LCFFFVMWRALLAWLTSASSDSLVSHHDYIVTLEGTTVGKSFTRVVKTPAKNFWFIEDMEIVLRRGSELTPMFVRMDNEETHDGSMVMQHLSHQLGASQSTDTKWHWNPNGTVSTTSRSGGLPPVPRLDEAPAASGLVGRWKSELQFRQHAMAGLNESVTVTLRPEFGLAPVTVKRWRLKTVQLKTACSSEAQAAVVWGCEIVGVPTNMTETYDENHSTLLEYVMDSPFGRMESLLCVGEEAERRLKAASADVVKHTALPEIVYSVAAKLDKRIPEMAWPGASRLGFRVSHVKGMNVTFPSCGFQRAYPVGDDGKIVDLIVDINEEPVAATPEESNDAEYLDPCSMVDNGDPEIIKLKSRILADATTDEMERAQLLRAGVRRHIRHSTLAAGFATASETVRERKGDCTEHAMLLTALLKADGIPARVCTGLLYSLTGGASMVWHMWSQALIRGRWRDLDATLEVPFHAGHMLSSTSSMLNILSLKTTEMEMLNQIGSLDVQVLQQESRAMPLDAVPRHRGRPSLEEL